MAYPHGRYEVMMEWALPTAFTSASLGPDLTSATLIAAWAPAFTPHVVRGVGVVFSHAAAATAISAGTLDFTHAIPAWSASVSATTIHAISLTGLSAGIGLVQRVLYKEVTSNVVIKPGEGVNFQTKANPTTGITNGYPVLYVEPLWDHPSNATGAFTASGGGV